MKPATSTRGHLGFLFWKGASKPGKRGRPQNRQHERASKRRDSLQERIMFESKLVWFTAPGNIPRAYPGRDNGGAFGKIIPLVPRKTHFAKLLLIINHCWIIDFSVLAISSWHLSRLNNKVISLVYLLKVKYHMIFTYVRTNEGSISRYDYYDFRRRRSIFVRWNNQLFFSFATFTTF